MATSYADHIIESHEVLAVLIETELGILLANCKVSSGFEDLVQTGLPEQEEAEEADSVDLVARAKENRSAAVNAALSLLMRLESLARPDSGLASSHLPQNCLQWEDSSGYSQGTR